MREDIDQIGRWIRIPCNYETFQVEMWRHSARGDYLVAEEMERGTRYSTIKYRVVHLPSDYQSDTYDDPSTALREKLPSKQDARKAVRELCRSDDILSELIEIVP